MPSGFSSALPSDVLLDTGILYLNSTTPYGVSKGGWNVDLGTEITNIDFDGKRSDVEGLDRITAYKPMITGTMIQLSAAQAATLLPGSTSNTAAGVTTVTPKAASVLMSGTDYQDNVRVAFKRGSGGVAWIKFAKAIVRMTSIKGNDKEHGRHRARDWREALGHRGGDVDRYGAVCDRVAATV
jgi:hypothetical protein